MDGCVLLTSTPSCVVSPRGETTHQGVDVNNTHPSMINPLSEASFATESFASDERKKIITFCRKLYTTSKDVAEMVAEWAEHVAKASSQYGHFAILASKTCSTAADVGGFIISGESSCSSQRIGNVDGMLWPVGKSLGEYSLFQGFSTAGGGHWQDWLLAFVCCPCW